MASPRRWPFILGHSKLDRAVVVLIHVITVILLLVVVSLWVGGFGQILTRGIVGFRRRSQRSTFGLVHLAAAAQQASYRQ